MTKNTQMINTKVNRTVVDDVAVAVAVAVVVSDAWSRWNVYGHKSSRLIGMP